MRAFTPCRPRAARVALLAGLPIASLLVGLSSVAPAGGGSFSHELHEHLGHTCFHFKRDRFLWAAGAAELADLRYDASTGRDIRNYPPDRLADHKRMVLRIDIPDMNSPRFEAVQTLTFAPISKPLTTLTLNAVELDIEKVEMDGRRLTHSYDGERLFVTFDPPLPAGREASIVTTYSCTSPVDGLFWLTEDNGVPGRPAQIHTQGQPESNRFWFPSHDFPNERLATELIVTVPDGYLVSSNGELRSESVRDRRRTFHWALDKPHPNYLVTLIVGKFDVVDVARPSDRISMPVYVPPGEGHKVRGTYGNTSRMLEVYERVLGAPYPWPRYAQLAVWNFGAGGMENTSATTMYDTAFFDDIALEDSDLDALISHELIHQWFGDYLTCNSWEHLWLNEGFAVYFESIWFEERDGYDAGYLYDTWLNVRGAAARDKVPAKDPLATPGMVSKLYADPLDNFRKASNPYPKGGSVLHMLRMKLGDEAFFGALRAYVDEHRLSTVRTHHLMEHMEKASGLSLEHFFEQWTIRPGTPDVTTTATWDESSRSLRLVVEQTQPIGPETPAFVFALPVKIHDGTSWTEVVIPVSERRHERTVTLARDPKMVCVDPDLHVLMTPKVVQPRARFIAQLREGPTIASRLDAAIALREHPGRDTTDALVACLHNTTEHFALRQRAAETLGRLNRADELLDALNRGIDNPRVRRSVVNALSETRRRDALPVFERLAANDRSYAVRAASIDAIGALGDSSHAPVVMSLLDTPSQHDQIRQAALGALAALDAEAGLDAAIRYIGPGNLQRVRAAALSAISRLAKHDRAKAFDAVSPLLYDSVERVRLAAASALVGIEDERGVELFRRAANNHPNPDFRRNCEQWADRLAGRLSGDRIETLQETVGRLRREIGDLQRAVDAKR